MMPKTEDELVTHHWGEKARQTPQLYSWTESPLVLEHVNLRISGDSEIGWLSHACNQYLFKDGRGVSKGLSIGCGNGVLERQARTVGAVGSFDAYDIALGAIQEAQKLAMAEGIDRINYEVKNFNNLELPESHYDVVFASSAIHHIKNLEGLFEQIKKTLKPGGLFIMIEYVGPSQFQFTPKAVGIINDILSILPPRFRRLNTVPPQERLAFHVSSVEYMNATDPSEAIRSAEILPLLKNSFEILEKKDFGGTINHMLLQGIIHNFEDGTPEGTSMLRLLLYFEDLLIREGILDSDFCFVVAVPR
jgi:ubiquinone/menaquinone biosynthesis C-methylase UbiE